MGRQTFCKLITTGNKPCFLMSDMENDGRDGIHLTVSDGESAWSGELTGDDLDDMARKIKMKFSDFVQETAKAFTRENVGSLNFVYQLKTCKDDALELTWKKHMAADDIKFQLGKVVLQQESDPSTLHKDIFSFCIDSMVKLKDRINSLQTDNDRLAQERGHALKRLEKCVAAKEELEKDLYSKFTAVLNSKKEKIRELKEEMEENSRSNGTRTKESVPKATCSTSDQRTRREIDKSDEEAKDKPNESKEDTTDDEKTPPAKRRRGTVTGEKRKGCDLEDASLVLGDGLEDEDTAFSRRPRRQASGGKRQTPSKPVLPRVTSGDRKQPSDRRSSMRKSGSGSSSKSSTEVIDADALLDDL